MYFGNENETYLFLERLIDDGDGELTIYVVKQMTRKPTEEEVEEAANGVKEIRDLLETTNRIIPDYDELYKIHFSDYLIYQTRNESYAWNDPDDEIRIGHGLVLFEKSKLLNNLGEYIDVNVALFMRRKTKYQHYGVYALDNIIDIISFDEPTIEKVERVL